jgi:hypothetical protein
MAWVFVKYAPANCDCATASLGLPTSALERHSPGYPRLRKRDPKACAEGAAHSRRHLLQLLDVALSHQLCPAFNILIKVLLEVGH